MGVAPNIFFYIRSIQEKIRGQRGTLLVWGLEYVNSSYVFSRNGPERKYVFQRCPHKGQQGADDVEISFVDERDFKKQENKYFWGTSGRLGEQTSVRATSINNFSEIDVSQPTPSVFLSVSLFYLGQ